MMTQIRTIILHTPSWFGSPTNTQLLRTSTAKHHPVIGFLKNASWENKPHRYITIYIIQLITETFVWAFCYYSHLQKVLINHKSNFIKAFLASMLWWPGERISQIMQCFWWKRKYLTINKVQRPQSAICQITKAFASFRIFLYLCWNTSQTRFNKTISCGRYAV